MPGIQNGSQNDINSENACTSACLNLYLGPDVCAAQTVTLPRGSDDPYAKYCYACSQCWWSSDWEN